LPSYGYLFISFAWDVLFSPFGYTERIQEAFLLVVICDLLNSDPAPAWPSLFRVRRSPFFARPVRRITWPTGAGSNRRHLHETGEGVAG
jgi:hypothetical protein